MFSNKHMGHALESTKWQLFIRFTVILLSSLILIQMVVGAIFFYDLYRVEKNNLYSLSVEYQRILKFESDEKLIHVLEDNPQRLIEHNIAALMTANSQAVTFVAGDQNLPIGLNFSEYNPENTFWIKAFLFKPYMTIKMENGSSIFWLVLDNQARYSIVIRQLQTTLLSSIILIIFTSIFVQRLIQNTISPLIILVDQLDKFSLGALDTFSAPPTLEKQKGLNTVNYSVHSAISKLQNMIHTMEATVDAIAHDIRTPLSRIMLASERALINPTKNKSTPDELESALSDCAEYATQASSMLTALMKLNDELSGKREAQFNPTDINEVLSRVVHWYEDIAEAKGITLHCINQPHQIFSIDADKLTQILVNLVDNALKYTDADGEVTLESSLVKNGNLEIKVTDTGIGIDEQYHSLIFKRLYRVDVSRSNVEGYGIGLSLAHAMLNNLGGTISIDSQLGEGSTFTLLFSKINERVTSIST